MTKKFTKKEMFATIKAQFEMLTEDNFDLIGKDETVNGQEIIDFIDNEIKHLDKKKSSSKPTEKQLANEKIKKDIIDVLTEVGEKMTISEMLKDSRLSAYSNQKISSLLTQLKNTGEVVNVHEKKVSYFSIEK